MSTSNIVYNGNLRTKATHLRSGDQIITDAPVDNNGKGEAFSPTDLAATALGSCAITVMAIAANKAEIEFEGSKIEMTKTMSSDSPRRITKIELQFQIKTNKELTADQKSHYEKVAHTCPVAKSLHPDLEQVMSFTWL